MQLNLLDVISRATTLAGARRDIAVSEVSFWANVAAAEIYGQVWHTPLEALAISSTTSGENRISLPSDFDGMISLSNLSTQGVIGGRQLAPSTGDQIDSKVTADFAEPEVYALYSSWMELYPTPDSSYSLQLRYWAKQPTITDSTGTPAFDERWHPGWLYKTAELLEARSGNPEGEALARNRYVNYMSSQRDDKTMRQQAKGISLRFQKSED
jgi:hypothetical protein